MNNKIVTPSIKGLDNNRRNAFRVYPEINTLSLRILDQDVNVINISSSGVAFTLSSNHHIPTIEHSNLKGLLSLNNFASNSIPIKLQLTKTENGIYRCHMQLPRRGFNTLCSYLVKKQIEDIKNSQKN